MIEQNDDLPFENTLPPVPGPAALIFERNGTISDGAADHAFMLATSGTAVLEID